MDDGTVNDRTLDGNAIGGMLMEIFGTEMTTAVGTCAHCGAVAQVAEFAVYRPDLGRLEMHLEITQSVVVAAFRAYFDNLWQSLPLQDRSKESVIAWLTEQMLRISI